MIVIDLIAGARPNFIKIAPIIDAIKAAHSRDGKLNYRLIHTGQHYDRVMSGDFFTQLDIPQPDINLDIGSGTHGEQTARIMMRYEQVLLKKRSALCLVVGDVTSTMACAITARKLGVPVAHVEAGLRSGDWSMPEEINRIVTDSITNWFFTTSETANQNLRHSGVDESRIFFVGNTMIDTLLKQLTNLRQPAFWGGLELERGNYFVVTLHRPSNVDDEYQLLQSLQAISGNSGGLHVIFPVHPRTSARLRKLNERIPKLHYVDPQGYLEFNYLVKNARGVITDSGGVTEETTVMGIPCLTMRNNTERPETIAVGTNELVGTDPKSLVQAIKRLLNNDWKKGGIPEKWDGCAAVRIVEKLQEIFA